MVQEMQSRVVSNGYDAVAFEYYDRRLHPTCWALGVASKRIVAACIGQLARPSRLAVELGAGAQRVKFTGAADTLHFDTSVGMLRNSPEPGNLVLADNLNLPLRSGTVAQVLAELADPYNTPEAWLELARILEPGGRALVTMPSHEWANAWRVEEGTPQNVSRFLLKNGRTVDLPSRVLPSAEQTACFSACGLAVIATHEEASSTRELLVAPKARIASGAAFVRGWLLERS